MPAASRFAFVPFSGRAPEGSTAACDGLVPGAAIDLSHWEKNRTPDALKADTSVEIALAFARSGGKVDLAVNNHFDADGALAVFVLVHTDVALAHAPLLVAAAEAGDFDEWPEDARGLRLEAAVRRLGTLRTEADAYERVLRELERVLTDIDRREDLWGPHWAALERARASVAQGDVTVSVEGPLAVIVHRRGIDELPGPVLDRAVREASAASSPGRARPVAWLLAFERAAGTYDYRLELGRYSWADTVRRPPLARPSRHAVASALGAEGASDAWALKGDLGMTGIVRTARPIAERPDHVAKALLAAKALLERTTLARPRGSAYRRAP